MEISTLAMASLLAFLPSLTSSTALPNLCDDVHLDVDGVPIHDATGTALARYCEQTSLRAPKWAAPVCCSFDDDDARCSALSPTGGCATDQATMWCDYGERRADGEVVCYQPLPDACNFMDCVAPPPGTPQEDATPLCCQAGGCHELEYGDTCSGQFTICSAPFTNQDGTVGCDDTY